MTKVLDKQNIFDVVLQQTGGVDNTVRVLKDNGLSFNQNLTPGVDLQTNYTESQKVINRYSLLSFKPNNGGVVAEVVSEWILTTGLWNDSGIWIDSELWIDS